MTSTPGTISYDIPSQWDSGFVTEVTWSPYSNVSGWHITLTFDGEISNVWNAQIIEHTGNTFVLENLDYNATVGAGETIEFGFQAAGSPADLAFEGDNEPPEPPEPPQVLVAGASALEGDPDGSTPAASVMGSLSTRGNEILNAAGQTVQIEAVNWFGLETSTYAPHGLWTRNWQEMMDEIKGVGFNAIRLPFSLAAVLDPDVVPNGIDFGQNPDLAGLDGLEILDKIVGYAEDIGLGIILDNHRSAAGDGPNGSGLWYDGPYDEADWIGAWAALAARYGDSPAIIGADLANEPHNAAWNDWAAAAERAGNAILEVTDNWLVIVEGVGSYGGDPYWWGGDLEGVADRPVTLSATDKLVYSPHDYPASVYDQPWFHDGSDLYEVFRENWGYIHEEGIAPILVGEFGSRLETALDRAWADAIVAYLGGDFDGDGAPDPGATAMNFAWWSWNPNSGDTGGILEDDWRTLRQNALDLLDPLLDDAGGPSFQTIRFEVTLSEAATTQTVVDYKTIDKTATAGEDYIAKSGSLVFAPGETEKFVDVTVLPDTVAEGNETFVLETTGPAGTTRAIGKIVDDDALPTITVENVRLGEGDGRAEIVATMSAPSTEAVWLRVTTRDVTATAGEDYRTTGGRIMFEPGETEASRFVRIYDDDIAEDRELFLVDLQLVGDAILDTPRVRVRILDDDPAPSAAGTLDDGAPTFASQATSDDFWHA